MERLVKKHARDEGAAADALQISRPTLARLLAGLPVQRATLAMVQQRLGASS